MSGVYINANRVYSSTELLPNAGEFVEGGLFVGTFVSGSTLMGIIVSESDLSTNAEWGCQGTLLIESEVSNEIGQAFFNTASIVGQCATSGISARLANDLVLNGYSDWALPTIDELIEIYDNLASIGLGNFSNHSYWSSTQFDANGAYTIDMNNGIVIHHNKGQTNRHTRAVRYYVIGTTTFTVSPTIYVNSSTATVVTYPSPPVESPTFYINPITSSSVTGIVTEVSAGVYFQGGIVVTYNKSTGVGTICTSDDISSNVWGTYGLNVTGSNSTTNGQANTNSILSQDSLRPIAASVCDSLTIGGYSDWFLPAPQQLNLMYNNLHLNGIGNFSTSIPYWSSRQSDSNEAITLDFSSGSSDIYPKNEPYLVRPMRSFTYFPPAQVNLIISQ
jgi:hypothetical protein